MFDRLAMTWREDREFSSSATDIVTHPAYKQIIAMGEQALPFILKDLEATQDHWGHALMAITGATPVPRDHDGKLDKIAQDWLAWAKSNNINWFRQMRSGRQRPDTVR